MKKGLIIVLSLLLVVFMVAACGNNNAPAPEPAPAPEAPAAEAPAEPADTGGEKYRIALSNAYLGNDWRQIMIKVLEVVAGMEPYASKVDLTIVNSEGTPEAQAASIDVLVEQGYDALLINCSSNTALNPAIDRALAAGAVVVTFDSVADHPDVYKIAIDYADNGKGWAQFLIEQLEPGAKIAVDTGNPGFTHGNITYESAMAEFEAAGIEVVAEFASEWADGVGQQQIGAVLAANPQLDGMMSQCYAETMVAAFSQAGRELIPATGYITNSGQLAALEHSMSYLMCNTPPGQSAMALVTAVKVLEGESVNKDGIFPPLFSVIDEYSHINFGFPATIIKEGVTAFPDLPPQFNWPVLPADFEPQVTIEQISGYAQ